VLGQGVHQGRSLQAVGDHRGRRRPRGSCWRPVDSAPTTPGTPRCLSTSRRGRRGSGRSRAATAPAARWRSGSWLTASTWRTCPRSSSPAHAVEVVAVVAVRSQGLRVQTVNRLQRLLSELTPGNAKKDITALQAKAILASTRPRDLAGKTRCRSAGREEDQDADQGTQGYGHRARLRADEPARRRPG
jgi:hypothetical protein